MKLLLHIPTESYGFVSLEVDKEEVPKGENLDEYAAKLYKIMSDAFKPEKSGEGLEKKEFDLFIDRMLMAQPNHLSDYELMSPEQQSQVQTIKRSQARIKRLVAMQEINDQQGLENIMSQSE